MTICRPLLIDMTDLIILRLIQGDDGVSFMIPNQIVLREKNREQCYKKWWLGAKSFVINLGCKN